MENFKKEALTLIVGSILFIILDFIVEYYLFDGLAIFLWVSTTIFVCLLAIGFIIYDKTKLNIPYLPFNKNKKDELNG
jgi:hypothetical protein